MLPLKVIQIHHTTKSSYVVDHLISLIPRPYQESIFLHDSITILGPVSTAAKYNLGLALEQGYHLMVSRNSLVLATKL